MRAFFCRCVGVISSDAVIDHLLEDRREVGFDAVLQLGGQTLPDVGGRSGHRASQSSATLSRSVTASKVSLVLAGG
jgi:hypothetical protein